jgi:mRNA interferase RelE/StbE
VAWRVEFLPETERQLRKIDRPDRERILELLRSRLARRTDPRRLGQPLRGPELGKYWKYQVGDHRIVCSIQPARVVIVVVRRPAARGPRVT